MKKKSPLNSSKKECSQGSTRLAILDYIKKRGPSCRDQLAKDFDLSPMAIYQQLEVMKKEGLVEFSLKEKKQVGRPKKYWVLSKKAESYFPDTHHSLAIDLLEAVRSVYGVDGVSKVMAARSVENEKKILNELKGLDDLHDKLQVVAKILSEHGYMAEVEYSKDGVLCLVENHCPIKEAACHSKKLCCEELSLFEKVMGPDIDVSKKESIIEGGRCCSYEFKEKIPALNA